jgi:hypothetical protein
MAVPTQQDGGEEESPGVRPRSDADKPHTPGPLERELGGDLPCVVCAYNLKGLSIRGVCPECGTAVRATILAVVDPHATEFTPIRWPHLLAVSLILWSVGGLAGALLGWLAQSVSLRTGGRQELAAWGAACVAISGLGALGLVHPHKGVPGWNIAGALVAVAAYVPLVWLVLAVGWAPWGWGQSRDTMALGLAFWLLVVVVLLGVRGNARLLVARSLVLRTGRTDRQTILAMVVAAVVAAAGVGLGLASAGAQGMLADIARMAGVVMVVLGSALVTLGLTGAVLDSWRIARAIVAPAPSLKDVLRIEESPVGNEGTAPPGGGQPR